MQQLQLAGQLELADQPYHQAILNDRIPLSIGGGIGQSRVYMLLLRKAHIGEVEVSVWPEALRQICADRNIHVLN
jgi:aspartate--ammonia ligase